MSTPEKDVTARIAYADSCLRAFRWHVRELERCQREYAELTYELEAALVSSPRIKSPEEALYRSSPAYHTGGLSDKVMQILDDRAERQADYDHALMELHRIGRFLRRLSSEDVEMIAMRYEYGMSYESIGAALSYSRQAACKKIHKILAQW